VVWLRAALRQLVRERVVDAEVKVLAGQLPGTVQLAVPWRVAARSRHWRLFAEWQAAVTKKEPLNPLVTVLDLGVCSIATATTYDGGGSAVRVLRTSQSRSLRQLLLRHDRAKADAQWLQLHEPPRSASNRLKARHRQQLVGATRRVRSIARRISNKAKTVTYQLISEHVSVSAVVCAPKLHVAALMAKTDLGSMTKRLMSAQRLAAFVKALNDKAATQHSHAIILTDPSDGRRGVSEAYVLLCCSVLSRRRGVAQLSSANALGGADGEWRCADSRRRRAESVRREWSLDRRASSTAPSAGWSVIAICSRVAT